MATSSSDSFPIAINATQQIKARLTPTNFPSWHAQFESLLLGYNLFGYVDGTHTCPPLPTSTDAAATTAHHLWLRQDKLILRLVSCSLKRISPSCNMAIAALQNFRDIVAPIRARESSLSFEELHDLLLGHEAYLRRLDSTTQSLVVTANTTQRRDSRSSKNQSSSTYQQSKNDSRSKSRQLKQYKYPPRCQYCDQQGHIAKYCPKLKPSEAIVNCTTTTSNPDKRWLIDFEASHNITSQVSNLQFHSKYDGTDEVIIGDGSGLPITHSGSLTLSFPNRKFQVEDTLCVPTINKNLISVHHFTKQNNVILEFHPTYFLVKNRRTGEILLQGPCENGVYPLPSLPTATPIVFVHERTSVAGWHRRLGHPSFKVVTRLISSFFLPTTSCLSGSNNCHSCSTNKAHQLPFHKHGLTSTTPFDLLYTDVWGPSPTPSLNGHRYYVIFVDHFTKYVWFFPLHQKSDVKTIFPHFYKMIETRFNIKIKGVYSDNGGEFTVLRPFFTTHGISHYTIAPYTPQQNGVSERRHRHIVETGQTLLSHASLPSEYWAYAFATATYLINRLPSHVLHHKSPLQALFKEQPRTNFVACFQGASSNHTGSRRYPSASSTPSEDPALVQPQETPLSTSDQAMSEEVTALLQHGTWELVPPTPGQNLVGYKFVFWKKRNPDGTISRYKAQLVAKDFINDQLDINNAFLHGNLEETVFMHQPPGFEDPSQPQHVCKLKRVSMVLNKPHDSVKDMGSLHYFLGIEVIPTPQGLFLSQHQYIRDLLSRTSMENAKETLTPMSTTAKLTVQDNSECVDSNEYCKIIGALQCLGLTHPNIAFVVNRLSQFMQKPTTNHWAAAKRLLRYLKQTMFHGILFQKHDQFQLKTYSDVDWASNTDTHVSTTAFITFIGPNPISWSTRKQRAVSRSSTEVEFRALATATLETVWLHSLIKELGLTLRESPQICVLMGRTIKHEVEASPSMEGVEIEALLAIRAIVEDLVHDGLSRAWCIVSDGGGTKGMRD
ncbi:Retrovirus-related Pol polyprotein from transposon RE2 [Vitis vinifera]|uniref:Retrovirus-related Pol polyprotein from transposon RE2 n=1 Tax=Vitis vinifera TaxID=29760 RepID=A0A438HA72_VITVI|nr:Retrovirus-related Pol polyprotein from transposon RE2 [Vitis vinifera]